MKEVTSYRDDPTLNLKVVTTHFGEREYRQNCKKIHKLYFKKNVECFEIDGIWFRVDTGLIGYNYSQNKWVLINKNKDMIRGIVDFKDKSTPVLGYFDGNPCENVTIIDAREGNSYVCMNADLASKYCVEEISTGRYYYNVSPTLLPKLARIANIVDNKQKGYNIEDNAVEFEQKIAAYNKYPTRISRHVALYSKLLGDISFGAEAECIAGYLPDYIQSRNGIIICRDGSLHAADGSQGPEYTTIPLTGAKGVQSLINMGKELTPRNTLDRHCAYHIHIGNLPTTRIFLVALYRLAHAIQDEVFQMFPYYKIDEKKYASKDKNYCKKVSRLSIFALKKPNRDNCKKYIDNNYIRIFTFLSNGFVPSKDYNRKLGVHPKANEKWNKVARYYWINFMNVIFSKRNTVEFRIHHGTTNPQKMVTWLFICNAIVKTAMLRAADILKGKKITFDDVLDYYGNTFKTSTGETMSNYLKEYVKSRKEYFKKDFDNGDYISEGDLKEDKYFHFHYPSVSEMFK